MIIKIPLSKWYASGNEGLQGRGPQLLDGAAPVLNLNSSEEYLPRLEDLQGRRCCLGFCAIAYGVPSARILGRAAPCSVASILPDDNWMLRGTMDSELAALAMELNDQFIPDDPDMDFFTRMGNLITVFDEGGDDLQFIAD